MTQTPVCVGGAYLAGEQAALDGVPLHGVRSRGALRPRQEPPGLQQPLLQLPETGLSAAGLRVAVLDRNTTQRRVGGAAVRSGKATRRQSGGRKVHLVSNVDST